MSARLWRRLADELEASSAAVKAAADRTRRGLLPDWAPRTEATENVREMYRLRGLLDDLIDAEIIRAVELGVAFSDLGSSRQQAQQRHARAIRQRGLTNPARDRRISSTAIDARTAP